MKTKLNRDLIARLAYATRPVISGGRVSKWEPNATSYIVFDSDLAGFGIKVCATHNVYVVQVRVGHRVVKATVGKDGQLTLKEARERARGLITDLKDGIDVNGEKRKARQKKPIPTVKQVLTDYKVFLADKARGKANPNTLKVLDRAIKNLNGIGSLLITNLSEEKVKATFTELANNNGLAAAEQAFEWLRAALNRAIRTLRDSDGKPLIGLNVVHVLHSEPGYIRTPVEKERHYLNKGVRRPIENTEEQMGAWLQAVFELRNRNRLGADYLLTTLLLGARMRETSPLVWKDRVEGKELAEHSYVDLPGKRVYFRETKNKLDHELPLGEWLLELLTKRHASVKGKFVFPARNKARSKSPLGYYSDPRAFCKSVTEKSRVMFKPHDLRRTFATCVNLMDISTITTKRLLNHRSAHDDTSKYAALGLEPLRPYMSRIEKEILRHAKDIDI